MTRPDTPKPTESRLEPRPGQSGALLEASKKMGVPMALPNQAALADVGLDFKRLPTVDPSTLDAAAKTIGGDLALTGSMVFSDEVH